MCKVLHQLELIKGSKMSDKQVKAIFQGIGEDLRENFEEHKKISADINVIKEDIDFIKTVLQSSAKYIKWIVIGFVFICILSGLGVAYLVAPHTINSQNISSVLK